MKLKEWCHIVFVSYCNKYLWQLVGLHSSVYFPYIFCDFGGKNSATPLSGTENNLRTVPTNTEVFLRGLLLCGKSRS